MAHHKLAAGVDRRQHHNESAEHACGLFGVAVAYEEITLAIDKELVELRLHRPGNAQALRRLGSHCVKALCPMTAADVYAPRFDLPCAPHPLVVHRFLAAAVGSALRGGHERFGLNLQQWQGNRPHAVRFQAQRKNLFGSGAMKIAGALHPRQERRQIRSDGRQQPVLLR